MRQVPAATANREFSRLLREVRGGNPVVITSHGEPVAKLVPSRDEAEITDREAAKNAFIHWLGSLPVQNLGKFNRDDAYDD